MGKKGVLLDNGKQAQSSMSLYWKAGRQKNFPKTQKPQHPQQKQQDIQKNAVVGMQKWKLHKQKMITKIYNKTQKKQQKQQINHAQIQRKRQQQIQNQLLQKQLNKNRTINIPGFKGSSTLKKKMEYQTVKIGNQQTNKLIFPSGQEPLTQQEIIQLLREKKAKKQMQKNNKMKIQKSLRVRQQVQIDQFLMSQRDNAIKQMKQAQKLKEEEQKKKRQKEEEQKKTLQSATYFKSDLLQRISNGQNVFKKKEKQASSQKIKEEQENQKDAQQQAQVASKPRFIPRALWYK